MSRVLAAALGAVGLAAAAGLMGLAREPLASLDAARARVAGLEALLARPPGRGAGADGAAMGRIGERLRLTGARSGVLVEKIAPAAPGEHPAGLGAVKIVASGPERAMLRFIGEIERGRPLIRLATWRLGASGEVLRLEADAVAVGGEG